MNALHETPFSAIYRHASLRPNHPALVTDETTVSYRGLRDMAGIMASGLAHFGVSAGDRLCIETHDPIHHFAASIAAMLCGAVAVALPNDSRASYDEVLSDAAPRLVLTNGTSQFEVDRHVKRVSLDEAIGAGQGRYAPLWQPDSEQIAMIYYTSGTSSGIRKGVLQSYRALEATARYITDVMKLDDTVIEYVASPMDNAFWFGRCRVLMHVGGTALLSTGRLNPLKILSAIKRHNGNSLAGDTPVFTLFLHHMSSRLGALGDQIRWAKIASQAMSIDDKRALQKLLPNARIIMNYGLTEAMRCCLLPFEDHPDKLGSVGHPSPGVSVRITSPDKRILGANEVGEIEVSGPHVASGYLQKPDMWNARFKARWYSTADLGYKDEDGFVFVLGRVDEAINVGGRKIAPNEVEDHLRRALPGRQLAVFPIPDPIDVLGDVIAVAIEGTDIADVTWSQLRIHLFEELPPSHVPREAFIIPELPKTANGKVQRNVLTRMASEGALSKLG